VTSFDRIEPMLAGHDGYGYSDPPMQIEERKSSSLVLPVLIWIPGVLGAAVFGAFGRTEVALIFVAISCLLHIVINPRVAIYALLVSIVANQLIGFIPTLGTIARAMGIVAGIVSMPRIFQAMSSGHRDPLVKWIFLFIVWGLVVTVQSSAILYSFILWTTVLLVYSMPLVIAVQLDSRRYLKTALIFVLLVTLLLAAMLIRAGADVAEVYERAELAAITEEAANDINEQARLMSFGVFVTIYLFYMARSTISKLACVAVGLLLCAGVLVSKSRACYLGVPLAVISALVISRGTMLPKKVLIVLVVVGLIIATPLVAQTGILGSGIQERFDSIFQEGIGAGHRTQIWYGYFMTSLYTGLVGNGVGGTRISPYRTQYDTSRLIAHNDALTILGDMGVLGLSLFVGMFVCLFRRVWKLSNKRDQSFGLMILVFMIAAGITQTDFYRKYYGLALSVVVVVIRLSEAEDRQRLPDALEYD